MGRASWSPSSGSRSPSPRWSCEKTCLIDMEQLIVGQSAGKRKRVKDLESMMQEILADALVKEGTMRVDALKLQLNEKLGEGQQQLASEAEFNIALKTCEQQGLCRRQGQQIEAR